MDRTLIEKITEMVLSKLQNQTAYLPLSDEEIADWKRLDCDKPPHMEAGEPKQNIHPLTEHELRDWSELSQFLQVIPSAEDTLSSGKKPVYFHKYIE